MRAIIIGVVLGLLLSLWARAEVIGKEKYCAISPTRWVCTAKTFNFCLYVLNQLPNGIKCIVNSNN